MVLPDCMMPDGAEPCEAFQERDREIERLRMVNALHNAHTLCVEQRNGQLRDAIYRKHLEVYAQCQETMERLRREREAHTARAEKAEDVAKRIAGHLGRPAHHMTGTQMAVTLHAIRSLVLPYIETDKVIGDD